MADLGERIRTRVIPALLTALGVTLLVAGLLTYTTPVTADAGEGPGPTLPIVPERTIAPRITLPPLASIPPATPTPSAPADRVATRVRIAALHIDLPVIKPGGPNEYPLCDVAMYIRELRQPGQDGATYLYAHARKGMFLPLLETSGKKQRGMVVEVWTSDDMRFLYEITEVRRGQTDLNDALGAASDELWLQTSEGPRGTPGKTQVIAKPLSVETADPKEAHPKPDPVVCG